MGLENNYNWKTWKVIIKMKEKNSFGAADTFRAAAIEQLEFWSKKLGLILLNQIWNRSSICWV